MNSKLTSFSLVIGSLKIQCQVISIILFAVFLMGILAGLYSIIHIDNPGTPETITSLILWAFAIPIFILIKGLREAEILNR